MVALGCVECARASPSIVSSDGGAYRIQTERPIAVRHTRWSRRCSGCGGCRSSSATCLREWCRWVHVWLIPRLLLDPLDPLHDIQSVDRHGDGIARRG
jgi:hypothetical protein